MGKIKSLEELAAIASRCREEGKTVVQCHGVFDLLHPGHYEHFERAKAMGDVLVVTVTPNGYVGKGPNRPAFGGRDRLMMVAKNEDVDYVALTEHRTAVEPILLLRPCIFAKGREYENPADDLTGEIVNERAAVESVGGRIAYTDSMRGSSSALLRNHFGVYPEEAVEYLTEFRKSHSVSDIGEWVGKAASLSVLVLGDTIIDEYHYCEVAGMAPKRQVLSHRYIREEHYAGGAVAAASIVAGFCGSVDLATALGSDEDEAFVRWGLPRNVNMTVFRTKAPTVLKRRFIDASSGQTVFYVNFVDMAAMGHYAELADWLVQNVRAYDLVVVNDFGHGFLEKGAVAPLNYARFLALNAQTNSLNWGFNLATGKYEQVDYLCQNELEMRLAAHDRDGSLEDVVMGVCDETDGPVVAVTLGDRGSLVYAGKRFVSTPAFTRDTVDTMGTGDAFFAVTAPLACVGTPLEVLGFVGNAAGAMAAQVVGHSKVVGKTELMKFAEVLLKWKQWLS